MESSNALSDFAFWIWSGVGVSIVAGATAFARLSGKGPAAVTTPVGDLRVLGAAFKEHDAMLQISEHLRTLCAHAESMQARGEKTVELMQERIHMIELSIKMGEKLSDDIRDIRKVLERRESRGGRQED